MLANNYIHKQYCIKDFNIASFSHLRTKKTDNLNIGRDFISLNATYVSVSTFSTYAPKEECILKKRERDRAIL